MEAAIAKIFDAAQHTSNQSQHVRLADQLLSYFGRDNHESPSSTSTSKSTSTSESESDYTEALQQALPMLQACLDCVVVVAKNEPVVKNIMAFIRCLCIESSRFSSSTSNEKDDIYTKSIKHRCFHTMH